MIGVADAQSGEAVKAFVVKKDPNVTAEDIIKFCGTQLTNYKVPKQIEFRTEPAEDQCRKNPAPRIARRKEGRRLRESVIPSPRHDAGTSAFWREAAAWYTAVREERAHATGPVSKSFRYQTR